MIPEIVQIIERLQESCDHHGVKMVVMVADTLPGGESDIIVEKCGNLYEIASFIPELYKKFQ